MNKKIWVAGYLISALIFYAALLAVIVLGILMFDELVETAALATGMVVVGVLGYLQFTIVHMVVSLVLLYSIWNALQDGVTEVTPGKAIGFLFIPVYNHIGYSVWAGYPTDYNQYLERHRLAAPQLSGTILHSSQSRYCFRAACSAAVDPSVRSIFLIVEPVTL